MWKVPLTRKAIIGSVGFEGAEKPWEAMMAKNGFKILDSDMHVLEPADLWQRYIDPEFRDRAPRGLLRSPLEVGVELEGKNLGLEGKGWESLRQVYNSEESVYAEDIARGFDPQTQLNAMDREGVDLAVLFPSRGLFANSFEGIDSRFSDAIARAYNNWMTDFCNQGDPSRMFGAALLPFQDVALSVKEAHRAVTELGHKTVFLRAASPSKGVYYHQPEFEPLFAEIQELGVPIVFHEGIPSHIPSVTAGRFANSEATLLKIAFTMEPMMAVNAMTLGGVLERFPDLKVGFLEGNGSWLPFLLWRLDEIFEYTGRGEYPELTKKPSECFAGNCFVSCDADETPIKHAIDAMGDEHYVFSTDYPHADSKYPEAVETFLDMPITEDNKRHILWDNCARLYGM